MNLWPRNHCAPRPPLALERFPHVLENFPPVLGLFKEQHGHVASGGGLIDQVALAQVLEGRRVRMIDDRLRRVGDPESSADEREKGVMLFASDKRCPGSHAFVEAGPVIER